MKLKCPECQHQLDANFTCENGHHFQHDEGVLILMNSDFHQKLYQWLDSFHKFQQIDLPVEVFETLPKSGIPFNKNIWKARVRDSRIVSSIVKKGDVVLDIGSWNGWLANGLTKEGCTVTAIDYFIHEKNGLKAKKQYSHSTWTSIQMDLENLSVLDTKFDLIVVNRCISYFTKLDQYIDSLQLLLKENGKILITGINYSKTEQKAKELIQSSRTFKEKHGKDLLFKDVKGYLTSEDITCIQAKGFKLKRYSGIKNKINHAVRKRANVSYYALFSK